LADSKDPADQVGHGDHLVLLVVDIGRVLGKLAISQK
jgi:hypothetical protein